MRKDENQNFKNHLQLFQEVFFMNLSHKNLVNQIEKIVNESQKFVITTVNTVLLRTYLKIGKALSEETNLSLRDLEKELKPKYGDGFSRRNLSKMIIFYKDYKDGETLSPHLSWSHYFELTSIKNKKERMFYEQECNRCCWSVRELKRQISSSFYERFLLGQAEASANIKTQKINENLKELFLKNPLVFEFTKLNKEFSEKDLEIELIKNLKNFLLELGNGFSFVSEQYRIVINSKSYFADLVFYNFILKCYVIIELKKGKITNNAIEQLNFYLNYFKTEVNQNDDNDPIGIVLCQDKDDVQIKYSLGSITNKILIRKYLTCLPDKELLRKEILNVYKANKRLG